MQPASAEQALPPPAPRWTAREVDTRQQTEEAVTGLTTPYKSGTSAVTSAKSPGFAFGTPVRHATVAEAKRMLFAGSDSSPAKKPDVDYLDENTWAYSDTNWTAKRAALVREGVLVFQAFAVQDK